MSWDRILAERLGVNAGTKGSWRRRFRDGVRQIGDAAIDIPEDATGSWMRQVVEGANAPLGDDKGSWIRRAAADPGPKGSWMRRLAESTAIISGNAGPPPVNTQAPVLGGQPIVGSALNAATTYQPGIWTNATSITPQYWLGGSLVAESYVPVLDDYGSVLLIKEVATGPGGMDSADSNGIATTAPAPQNVTPPVLSGTATVGIGINETLIYTPGDWNYDTSISPQFLLSGSPIDYYYVPIDYDEGLAITVRETATGPGGSDDEDSNQIYIDAATSGLYSMNMSPSRYYLGVRPLTNLAWYTSWALTTSAIDPPMIVPTNMTRDGELVAVPTGKIAAKTLQNPNVSGSAMTFYWEESSTGVTLTGPGISGASAPVAHGAGWKIECTHTWSVFSTATALVNVTQSALTGAPPTNVIYVEKATFDALPGGDVSQLSYWHPDYVAWHVGQDTEYLRFMDWMDVNLDWYRDIAWADWADVPFTTAAPPIHAFHVQGALRIQAQEYYATAGEAAYFGARTQSPLDPFYARGNDVAISILSPSGGAIAVNVIDTVDGEVHLEITPAVGRDTTTLLVADLNDDTKPWFRWIRASGTGGSAVGTLAKTFLQYGQDGGAPGGLPIDRIIELCVLTGKKPWIPTPFRADDDCISQVFTIINSDLPSLNRDPRHEDANETWNSGFKITGYIAAQAFKQSKTIVEIRGENHVRVMTASTAACPDVIATLSYQHYSSVDLSNLLAVSGVIAISDDTAGAIYVGDGYPGGGNAIWTSPSATTDPDVLAERVISTIQDHMELAAGNRDDALAAGLTNSLYEINVGIYGGAPTLADQQVFQRDPVQRRILGITFSEMDRLGIAERTRALFMDASPITNSTGSWGYHETQLTADVDSPKWLAASDAMNGIFPAYFELGSSLTLDGTPYVGVEQEVIIPTAYNAVAIEYQWLNFYSGDEIVGETAATFTPDAGDTYEDFYCRVRLRDANDAPFDYYSPNTGSIQPVTKWVVIRNADLIAGNYTLPADWSDTNRVMLWGCGGNGIVQSSGGHYRNAGGSGGYTEDNVVGLAPSAVIPCVIPLGGTGTATSFNSGALIANAGANATNVSNGSGAGGAEWGGTADLKRAGTRGGNVVSTFTGSAGGAGAPGPDGLGARGGDALSGSLGAGGGGANGGSAGEDAPQTAAPGDGGNNRLGTGGGLAATASVVAGDGVAGGGGGGGFNTSGFADGGDGSMDDLFTDSVSGVHAGPGSGPGGVGSFATAVGGAIVGYGAGAAGARAGTAVGGQALIVLEYVPA